MKWFLLIASLVMGVTTIPSAGFTGQLTRVDHALCDHRFDGKVEPGDAQLFKSVRGWKGLCLNSPGGSFVEGLEIEKLVEGEAVRTVVLKGDECYSSCALIFMGGGSYEDGLVPMRTLEVGGKLGFHAPYSTMKEGNYNAEQMDASYFVGLQSVAKMISLAEYAIPNTMMVQILNTPPDQLYMIDSPAKANTLHIDLAGVEAIAWTKQNLFNACATKNGWDKPPDYFEPDFSAPLPTGGMEYRWGGYGDEASGSCVVRVSKDLKRAYVLPTFYDGNPEIRDADLQALKESDAFVAGSSQASSKAEQMEEPE